MHTPIQSNSQKCIHTYIHTYIEAARQAYKHTDRDTHRKREKRDIATKTTEMANNT